MQNSQLSGLIIAIIFCEISSVNIFSQKERNFSDGGGWESTTDYGIRFNQNSIEIIDGEVISIDNFIPSKGMSEGVHIFVKTNKESISVHLGPTWYLDYQHFKIQKFDLLEIKGSRIIFDGKAVIMAVEIRNGAKILKLRDNVGFPLWNIIRRK